MPFREIYMTAFKNDIEYSQLVLHTAAVLQSNKFIQVQSRRCISELGLWLHNGNKRAYRLCGGGGLCVLFSASSGQKE